MLGQGIRREAVSPIGIKMTKAQREVDMMLPRASRWRGKQPAVPTRRSFQYLH